MTDDPTQVLKVYFIIDGHTLTTPPTAAQWQAVVQAARAKPLVAAIVAYGLNKASQNEFICTKVAQGTYAGKALLGCFEVDADDVARANARLSELAAQYGVTGTAAQKFGGCLQYELRAAATDLGWATAATRLNVSALIGDRMTAIQAAQAYLATNSALWHGVA